MLYISILSNNKWFLGLVDTGAAISCIDPILLSLMDYRECHNEIITHIKGVSGARVKISNWVQIKCTLQNGRSVWLTFAIVSIRGMLIFGLPSLIKLNAIIDLKNLIIHMKGGPIELIGGENTGQSGINVNAIDIIDTEEEGDKHLKEIFNMSQASLEVTNAMIEILKRFKSLWDKDCKGLCKFTSHSIKLSTNRPIVSRPRPLTLEQQKIIDNELTEMINSNIIRPSNSPYSSEVVLVRKKDGPWRFCIDFRLLNLYTISDPFPLPRISDLLHSVRNSKYFIALDLRAGYWQIKMQEDDINKTAFRTHRGLYEFLVMPFGLKTAPATFQRTMEQLIGDLRWKGVLVYLDDILIHGVTEKEALSNLEVVFRRLQDVGMTININKCKFMCKAIKYLGHIVGEGTLKPDPEKVEVLSRISPPKRLKDVRSIHGYFSWYRAYIPNFSEKAGTLTSMLKKNARFTWGEKQQDTLDYFVNKLKAAVLAIPLEGSEFMVETDASDYAVGAILSCRTTESEPWKPAEFASKSFSMTERRWPTREKEAFAIKWAVEKFDGYLRGRTFNVYTDHHSLQWMLSSNVGKISRWAAKMAEYDMTIIHKKGLEMTHVDFLSRHIDRQDDDLPGRAFYKNQGDNSDDVQSYIISKGKLYKEENKVAAAPVLLHNICDEIIVDSKSDINKMDKNDSGSHASYDIVEIPKDIPEVFPADKITPGFTWNELLGEQRKVKPSPNGRGYSNNYETICYRNGVWVPQNLRLDVLARCHSLPPYRHPGAKKTKSIIKKTFDWPGLHQDVAKYIKSCLICQRLRPGIERLQLAKRVHPVSDAFEKVHVDIWGPSKWKGVKFIVLTMIDPHTKWAECVDLPDEKASTVASKFLQYWICRFGVPKVVITDQGTVFMSEVFSRMASSLGISLIRSTVYHPQGNAPVESFHRTLKKGLKQIQLEGLDTTIADALQLVCYSYRSTIHLTTGESPAYLTMGIDPRPPMESAWPGMTRNQTEAERLKYLSTMRLNIMYQAKRRQEILAERLGIENRCEDYKIGDLVIVKLDPYQLQKLSRIEGTRKLTPLWGVPARVVRATVGVGRVYIKNLLTMEILEVHKERLRPVNPPLSEFQKLEWERVLAKSIEELKILDVTNREGRNEILQQFWREIDTPQTEILKNYQASESLTQSPENRRHKRGRYF